MTREKLEQEIIIMKREIINLQDQINDLEAEDEFDEWIEEELDDLRDELEDLEDLQDEYERKLELLKKV